MGFYPEGVVSQSPGSARGNVRHPGKRRRTVRGNPEPQAGTSMPLPRVLADLPVSPVVIELLGGRVELVPWDFSGPVDAIYTYGHPTVDGPMLDRFAGAKVVSNFGVGVDHIDLK